MISSDPSMHDTSSSDHGCIRTDPHNLGECVRETVMSAYGDPDAVANSIRTIARMLIERRDHAARAAQDARRIAVERGYDYSLTAEQMEGSHAAYVIAIAIVSGAMGEPIDKLAADDPAPDPASLLYAPDVVVTDLDAMFRPISERQGVESSDAAKRGCICGLVPHRTWCYLSSQAPTKGEQA